MHFQQSPVVIANASVQRLEQFAAFLAGSPCMAARYPLDVLNYTINYND